MTDYSLAVALFDYLPVAVGVLGYALLAGGIAARDATLGIWSWLAVLLVLGGGLCKASWKLVIALSGEDWVWLDRLLFILVAPGLLILATGFHESLKPAHTAPRHRRGWRSSLVIGALLPWSGALLAVALAPGERYWFLWLLAVTTLANAALVVLAMQAAGRWRLPGWVRGALAYGFIATLALSGLSRLPPGEATAWLQQSLNLSAQASLALAFWQLSRALRAPSGVHHVPHPA